MLSVEMFNNRISLDNPWWRSGQIANAYALARPRLFINEVYPRLIDWALRRAVLLLGPRRVGKTWLMQHLIGRLINEDVLDPRYIVYISVDAPIYHGSGLEELLQAVGKLNGYEVGKQRMVVFFDEIQYLKDWEVHLKAIVEAYPNIRFMASGSAASALARGSIESGAGRFTDMTLAPLSFFEYVHLTGTEGEFSSQVGLTTESGETFRFPDVESLERVNRLFLEYMNYGGYPELVANRSVQANPVQFIQRDIVDKVLLRDLPSLYHIEDVRDLQVFFSYLAFHSGMIQSWESLAQGSGLTKSMVTAFLRYLEDAFLVLRHDRVDITASSLQRATQFKVYLTNTALRASMFQPVLEADDSFLGYSVETAVSAQLGLDEARRVWRYANWKVGRRQHEVDFVRIHPGTQKPEIALEVKWSDGPFDHPAEVKEAVAFCQRNGLGRLWVTSRTQRGIRRLGSVELVFVPTALFSYELGRGGVFK